MKLLELRLENFRQHADTHIRFGPGLTGIIGPNGAGKSTLLEAIAWAIYGSDAARGTNDTLRFARAAPRTRVGVDLRFALGGHEYRVVRTLSNAEVYLDNEGGPVASSIVGVTRYLEKRIGMDRREFFNTYFTGQKELQFLATMGSAERGRFLSQVLGYERLRRAQEHLRTRRNELRHEVEGLRTGMRALDEILAEKAAAEAALQAATEAVAGAEAERAEAAEALAEIAPRWAEAQTARDRHRELSAELETSERERAAARRDLQRAESELQRIAGAAEQLQRLQEQLEPLPDVTRECERLAELARVHERRRALAEQVQSVEQELKAGEERLEGLEKAPALLEQYTEELERLRAELGEVREQLDERKTTWLRDRQDAQTKLQNYRERGAELKEQIRQIREAGPEGECPTCERPLGDDFERVLDELEDEWANIVQDGKWWKSRHDDLQPKPDELRELEQRQAELSTRVDDRARRQTRCEAAAQELEQFRAERAAKAERVERLRAELAELPAGYDREAHQAAEARLRTLRALDNQRARLEETTTRRPHWEQEKQDAEQRAAAAGARGAEAAEARAALGFSDEGFAELKLRHQQAGERRHQAELRAAERRGEAEKAEQARASAQRAEAQFQERAREIEAREISLRHHNELDAAFSELRAELNARVRPELSEIASIFLAQLTDGRYTSLEIDDAYNILVLDEGEEKPVISGGEEDVANLVLRLSLSQMIAERAGHPLSLLILDEVFGSLDVARRDNVVQLLRRLEDRFDQVILITHIEGIRESLDQVLRVGYDERSGASVVREDSFVGTDDVFGEGIAAD